MKVAMYFRHTRLWAEYNRGVANVYSRCRGRTVSTAQGFRLSTSLTPSLQQIANKQRFFVPTATNILANAGAPFHISSRHTNSIGVPWGTHGPSIFARTFMASTNSGSYYDLLGIRKSASDAEVKKAYFKQAKKWHPDLNDRPDAKAKFQQINEAYSTLKDPARRREYDTQSQQSGSSGFASNRQHDRYQQAYTDHGYQQTYTDYRTQWDDAFVDFGVKEYFDNMYMRAQNAVKLIQTDNDWSEFKNFVNDHKVFFASVIIPLAALLRFPGLLMGALRGVFLLAYVFDFMPRPTRYRIARQIFKYMKDDHARRRSTSGRNRRSRKEYTRSRRRRF